MYAISAAFSQLDVNPTIDSVFVTTAGVKTALAGNNGLEFLTTGSTVDFVVASPSANITSESTGLFADVSLATPLPKSVWAGAGLLGIMGVLRLRRTAAV